jgi:predicted GNAT family acetyltransferase
MNAIELKLNDQQRGAFVIDDGAQRLAEMAVAIIGGNLTVYHTEVSEALRGQGVAQKLLNTMVEYARKNNLKVVALCPYVHKQFQRHPEQYADIWNQRWHA